MKPENNNVISFSEYAKSKGENSIYLDVKKINDLIDSTLDKLSKLHIFLGDDLKLECFKVLKDNLASYDATSGISLKDYAYSLILLHFMRKHPELKNRIWCLGSSEERSTIKELTPVPRAKVGKVIKLEPAVNGCDIPKPKKKC